MFKSVELQVKVLNARLKNKRESALQEEVKQLRREE
jgi:hypothetical protein